MLERTAAGLESGHLHRVLPRSTRPPRHLRQPRASFSQSHASRPIARTAEPRGSQHDGASHSHDTTSPLLDFLYPKRTHPLLRRQSFSSLTVRPQASWPACAVSQRRYESTESSKRSKNQQPESTVEKGSAQREFDHDQWTNPGTTPEPKATYSLEEDDPPPLEAERDKKADIEETKDMLKMAWTETEKVVAQLRDKRKAENAANGVKDEPLETVLQADLIDLDMEHELRDLLKSQIAAEEALDDFERQGETSKSSVDPERQSKAGSKTGTMGEEKGSAGRDAEARWRARFEEPKEPVYALPEGEEGELLQEDGEENRPKRRSRFAAPDPDMEQEEEVSPQPTPPQPVQVQAEASAPVEPVRELTLEEMLEDVEGGHYHAIHDAHARLGEKERDELRPRVIVYLAKSRSIVEAGRVKALVRHTPVEDWTNDMLSATILVLLRSDDQTLAFDTFRTGLRERGLTGGFQYLLIDSVNKHQWHLALDAWLVYCKDLAKHHPGQRPDNELLESFSQLDSLGGLYFLFERYLGAADRKVERFMDSQPVSKKALYGFRRMLAKAALESHCPPKQARVILGWWYQKNFYSHYLWDMAETWAKKEISNDTARQLIPIYEDFARIPNLKISTSILAKMFVVCFPQQTQTLEQLHMDWIRIHGDLDQWGYKRFMMFYAHRGDAERVKTLWRKYIELYPDKRTHAQVFNNIINAYAQSGDTESAEAEVTRMKEQFGIEPNAVTMNNLLKAYMREGNYEETLARFKKSLKTFVPDFYTYAHMMAICSKKGDLAHARELFEDAQDKHVTVTKEMVLSLVVAYGGNDQGGPALGLARALADQGVTSTAIWNHVVLFFGKTGNLTKCYAILEEMKERDIEWDHDTIDNLLQALIQVKQVGAAYEVLKKAMRDQPLLVKVDHYTTVMMGAARNHDTVVASQIEDLLQNAGLAMPFNATVAYTALMLDRKPNAGRTPTLAGEMVESLRRCINDVEMLDMRKRRQQTKNVPWCVELLIDFRDFDAIEETISLYTQLFPEYKNGNLPPDIMAALMQGYQQDNDPDRVIAMWDDAWARLRRNRTKPTEGGIYSAHEYDLDRLMFRLADAYRSLGTSDGLATALAQVHEAGFKLMTRTWDRIIATLAITGNWKIGVYWCETVLMRNWAGWSKKLGERERRARSNPRYLWPQRRTVLALREGWIAERQLAAWSAPIARSLVSLDIDHPRTINAFRDALEPLAPGGPWIMDHKAGMESLVKALPLKELKIMEKELIKYLDDEEKILDQEKSPFRVKVENEDRVRSLSRKEMRRLKGLLEGYQRQERGDQGRPQPLVAVRTATSGSRVQDSASG